MKPPSPGQFSLCAHALTVDGNRTPQPFLTGLLSCVRQSSMTSSRKRGGACQGRLIERSGGCGRRVAAVRAERLDRRRVVPARRPATASVAPTGALRRVRAPLEGRAPSRPGQRKRQAAITATTERGPPSPPGGRRSVASGLSSCSSWLEVADERCSRHDGLARHRQRCPVQEIEQQGVSQQRRAVQLRSTSQPQAGHVCRR